MTVSRYAAHRYFVSILVEDEIEIKAPTQLPIGIDLGLQIFAIFRRVTHLVFCAFSLAYPQFPMPA